MTFAKSFTFARHTRATACALLLLLGNNPSNANEFIVDGYLHDSKGTLVLGPDQWGLDAVSMNAKKVRSLMLDSKRRSVIVAVIDTGIDYEHPDLEDANIWFNTTEEANGRDDDNNGYVDDLMGWDFINNDNDPWDDVGHGTHVAGIIAATTGNGRGIAGVDGRARIMALRALNTAGRGLSSRIASAIYYAVNNGASVINLSMAVRDFSPHEQQAVKYAAAKGVVVVVASGNAGEDTQHYTPAVIDGAITVAAFDRKGERPGFSNWGSQVDISAPGVDIVSLRAQSTDFNLHLGDDDAVPKSAFRGPLEGYYSATGTSFAAPFVSGAASLLLSTRSKLSATDVKRILLNSARDIGSPGRDKNTGYGSLDIAAALTANSAFFLTCEIESVEVANSSNGPVLRVNGAANADKFQHAELSLGQGEAADAFSSNTIGIKDAVESGALADIPTERLRDTAQWTIRMQVQHKSGVSRECRYEVSLN